MALHLNLNADLGESYGAWTMGNDAELLPLIDSANLACGFHAGDPLTIRRTLQLAKAAGTEVGAHVAFPDLQGFGRRPMQLPPAELEAAILYQIAALDGLARLEGLPLIHVKPHGALSNLACADAALAKTVATAIKTYRADLILLAPARSQLYAAGQAAGLPVAAEIFADRAYQDDGNLVPRNQPGALIHSPAAALAHILAMLDAQALISLSGHRLPTPIDSICVHGDSPQAVATARYMREELERRGVGFGGLG